MIRMMWRWERSGAFGGGGKYHRSPQPPPPGLPADCRTALGARPQKLQSGLPWAAAAAPPCVRRLPWSLSSPRVRLHVGAPWSCCSAPGSALSCQVATGQPGASVEGGGGGGCWMPFVCSAFPYQPYIRAAPSKDKIGLFITLTYMRGGSSKRARTRLIKSRPRGYDRLISCFVLAVCFHSWGCMNGASWMEAARQHKRAESGDYTQRLERPSVSRAVAALPRAGKHRGPRSILFPPAAGRLARFGGADAGEAGEGRHPTSALKKNNKCTRAGLQACVTPARRAIGRRGQQRKWCRSPRRPILTRIHRLARVIIFVPTPPDSGCSCQSWFMIGRLFGIVSQRVPSLFHRVSLMMKPQVVFVLGGPGAGKGTQCSKIVEVR